MNPLTALRVAAGVVLAGAAGAVLWWLVAPVAQVVIRSDGGYFVDPDPEQYAASDAWFGLVALGLGLLVGVLTWYRTRERELAAVVGLAAGGIVGSLVMWHLGQWLGRVDLAAAERKPVGSIISVPLKLQSKGLLVVLPVAALVAWLVCDLVSDYRTGRAERVGPEREPVQALTPDGPPAPPPPPSA